MPGVVVKTAVNLGPGGAGEVPPAQAFFVGTTERGSLTEPTLVRGVGEFETYFGGYEAGNLWTYVKTFFEEGGQRLYVQRALGATPVTATLVLVDRATTPENTITIDAANPGAWGNNVEIAVEDGDATNTFKIKVYLDSALIYTTRDLTDPADAVNVINTSSVKHIIVATDMASTSTAPDNNAAVISATSLATGANGSALVEADYTAALDLLGYELGVGAVAIPGQSGAGYYAALLAHAQENSRIALCAFAETDTAAAAKTAVASYYADSAAEYGAFYYPWIKIPDPAFAGLTINNSPEAYAAAARAKAVIEAGPWRAGAGLISEASYVVGLYDDMLRADADIMDEKRINVIRSIAEGIRVYGARSVSSDEDNWRYITMRDTMNWIVNQAEVRLEPFVFEVIDSRGSLFSRMESSLIGMLDPIRIDGGLYEAYDADGNMVDPGYEVEVSDSLNPAAQLAQGKVAALISVRVSSIGDLIEVTVTKSNLTASVL